MKKNISHYLFEILAIFIGITGSFLVEDYRINRIKQKQIDYALEALLENLQADSASLAFNIISYDSQVVLVNNWLNEDYEQVPQQNIFMHFYAVNSSIPFNLDETGYDIFIETEGKELIKDPSLRKSISSYYTNAGTMMEIQSKTENDFLIALMNVHLGSNTGFPPKSVDDPAGLKELYLPFKKYLNETPEARNRLVNQLFFMYSHKERAINTLALVNQLKTDIKNELDR